MWKIKSLSNKYNQLEAVSEDPANNKYPPPLQLQRGWIIYNLIFRGFLSPLDYVVNDFLLFLRRHAQIDLGRIQAFMAEQVCQHAEIAF